jgi:hypothetical protein
MSALKDIKEEYLTAPKDYIKNIETSIGININKLDIIEDTNIFNRLINNLSNFKVDNIICSPPFVINTLVEGPKGYTLKIHNCLTYHLGDKGFIRISPTIDNKIELTRIETSEPQKGIGSQLMDFLFHYLETTLGFIPPVQVELTGAVGIGHTYKTTPINKQQMFFKKHGFSVIDKQGIIRMEKPFKK